MKELIGVQHSSKKCADAVFEYVVNKYKMHTSLMLEIHPDDNPKNFFGYLEMRFSEKPHYSIIRGDHLGKEAGLSYAASIFGCGNNEQIEDIILNQRNENMKQVVQQTNPDIVLLGAAHSAYLKKYFPDVDHTLFVESEFFQIGAYHQGDKKFKEEILSSANKLFTVGLTLIDAERVKTRHPSLEKVARVC